MPFDARRPAPAAAPACTTILTVALRIYAVAMTEERAIRAAALTLYAGGPRSASPPALPAMQRIGIEVRAHLGAVRQSDFASTVGPRCASGPRRAIGCPGCLRPADPCLRIALFPFAIAATGQRGASHGGR